MFILEAIDDNTHESDKNYELPNENANNTNLELIEIYTQKLIKLQQSINENFPDSPEPKLIEHDNHMNLEFIRESPSSPEETKIKFKHLFEFKKDIVIRKLLKTIDLMNIELSKY